jgi:DNA modification methylase
MGSFYRSQHEHIAVFVTGGASPTNNFGLGARGRYRTNVWNYPGVNSLGSERDATLAMHPTVKPVALVEDALRDCSHRNEIVLDPFAGSGTTMIAAQKSGRHARLIEIDPFYCDVIVRRFQEFTGESAVLTDTGETFAQREAAKAPDAIELVRE